MACEHIGWISATAGSTIAIQDHGRLGRLLLELPQPESQRPSLWYFVGTKTKTQALQEIFTHNRIKRWKREEICGLRLDNDTIEAEHPILFADSDTTFQFFTGVSGIASCHEVISHPLKWPVSQAQNYWNILHARILFPLADVICLFASDFRSSKALIGRLRDWCFWGAKSPKDILPAVLIVVTEECSSATADLLDLENLRESLQTDRGTNFQKHFASLSVMELSMKHLSPRTQFQKLKNTLHNYSRAARVARFHSGRLFSATHMDYFFRHHLRHISLTIEEQFSCIAASRLLNQLDDTYTHHMATVFQLAISHSWNFQDTASIIASAILMDAYPPRMHSTIPIYSMIAD
jgi:hypothetical protein